MNRVTQQNAANAQESAAAAEELNSQAAELKGMVGTFVISKNSNKRENYYPSNNYDQKRTKKSIEIKPDVILPLDDFDADF